MSPFSFLCLFVSFKFWCFFVCSVYEFPCLNLCFVFESVFYCIMCANFVTFSQSCLLNLKCMTDEIVVVSHQMAKEMVTKIESKLSTHFTKIPIELEPVSMDEMMKEGDYWEFTEPKTLESWSFKMIPHTDNMHFNMKHKNSAAFLPISFDEKIKRIVEVVFPEIKIHCVTTTLGVAAEDQYHFTIVLNSEKINFNITPFLESLEPTPYSVEVKELEESVDRGEYHNKDGTPLTGKRLCTKLGLLMNSFEVFKAKHNMQRSFMASCTVSVDYSS